MEHKSQEIVWNDLSICLLPQKVIYIEKYKLLIVSDWHLGKLGHFRQEGLFVPPMQLQEEFDRLAVLLLQMSVRQVVFLGDLFHSTWNTEWDAFSLFTHQFHAVDFILTKGNHDILKQEILAQSRLYVVSELFLAEGVLLSHEPRSDLAGTTLNIVGHLHPGVAISSPGRQRFRLPCFFMEGQVLTVPAFGKWTGLYLITKNADNRVYAVIHDAVLEIK